MHKCTVLYPDGFFKNTTANDFIDSRYDVEMTFLPQKNFSVSAEVLIIAFELMKNLAYSASYDLMKHTILSVINNIIQNKKIMTTIIVINDGQKSEIKLPFEPTEEQKDKLVDAAIQKFLS